MKPDPSAPAITCPLCRHSPCEVKGVDFKRLKGATRTIVARCPKCGAEFQITRKT